MPKSIYRVYPLSDYVYGDLNVTFTNNELWFTFNEYSHELDEILIKRFHGFDSFHDYIQKYDRIPEGKSKQLSMIHGWLGVCRRGNVNNFLIKIKKITRADLPPLFFIHVGHLRKGGYQRTYITRDVTFVGIISQMFPVLNVQQSTVDISNKPDGLNMETSTQLTEQELVTTLGERLPFKESNSLIDSQSKVTTPIQISAGIIEKAIRRIGDIFHETADEIRHKFKL